MDITEEMRRHSAAHIVARAVCNLFPGTQTDIGPATEDGFYYDFDLEHRITPEDFPAIEKEAARLIALDEPFVQANMTQEEVAAKLAGQKYKLERLADVAASGEEDAAPRDFGVAVAPDPPAGGVEGMEAGGVAVDNSLPRYGDIVLAQGVEEGAAVEPGGAVDAPDGVRLEEWVAEGVVAALQHGAGLQMEFDVGLQVERVGAEEAGRDGDPSAAGGGAGVDRGLDGRRRIGRAVQGGAVGEDVRVHDGRGEAGRPAPAGEAGAGQSAYLAGAASAGARAARAALSFARRVFQPFSEQAGSSLWVLPSV